MAFVTSGERQRRITIERLKTDATQDAAGEVNVTLDANWETYIEHRWARILPRTAREFWHIDQVDADVTHLLKVLWDSQTKTITSAMRAKLGGRVFQFTSVFNAEEANREMWITAIERTA